jgi:hypothetical protein
MKFVFSCLKATSSETLKPRQAHKIFIRKPEDKRPLERPKCRWENIEMNLKELGCEDAD